MTRTDIVIIGINPRSLGIAILAKEEGLHTTLVDPFPLRGYPQNLPWNTQRREPISVDVLTGCSTPNLGKYRLSQFLGYPPHPESTLEEIEHAPTYCTTNQFSAYLHAVLVDLEQSGYVQVVRETVQYIIPVGVINTDTETIRTKNTIIALEGIDVPYIPPELDIPNLRKVLDPLSDITPDIRGKQVVVLGQGKLEIATLLYLCTLENSVTHIIDKPLRTAQYHIPSTKEWGDKSALGDYYANHLIDPSIRMNYIRSTKEWQPSISPTQAELLNKSIELGLVEQVIKPDLTNRELQHLLQVSDYVVGTVRKNPTINSIPYAVKPLPDALSRTLPLLNRDFTDTLGNYYSGPLAIHLDGPRQTSLISSGSTARKIIDAITAREDVR